MSSIVNIIHRSSIVCHGLTEMLRRYYKGSVYCYNDLVSFEKQWDRSSERIVVFVEDNIASGKDFSDFYSHNSTMQYVSVCNNRLSVNDENTEMSLCLFDTEQEIHTQIERILEQVIVDNGSEGLSDRELDVLKLVAVGFSNKEIAEKLFISIHTVMSHRKNITEKLGIKSISGLTVYAIINNHLDTTNLNISDLI